MFAITIRERSGQVYTFHFDKPEVLIGRVKGNDVILPKQNISKRHTLVKAEGKRFIVEDLGSTNGTYVNGHRIATAVEVGADDKVYIGDFVMNFTDLNEMSSAAPPDVPPAVELGEGFAGPEIPGLNGLSVPLPTESAHSIRATQHMQGPPAVPVPTTFAEMDLGAGFGDGLLSDLPAVEPLDMPNELVQLQGESQEPDYFDRLTGPVDAMAQANLFRPGSALANIPGLAGAIKPPTTGPQADAAAVKAPVGLPSFAPVATDAGRPAAATSGSTAAAPAGSPADLAPLSPAFGFAPAVSAAAAPLPSAGHTDVPEPETNAAPLSHHDQLAVLFRNAMRDLRPSLPSDASQMSDSDWAEMEERVTAFVDQCAIAGEIPAEADLGRLRLELIYELAGLGPLELMLDDAEIEAIEVNSPAQLYVVRRGKREVATERFSCQQALALAVDRLVRATGQTGRSGSSLEGTLVDGTSVFVVWPPLCPAGPAVLLRKPRTDAPDLEQLVGRGTVTPQAAETLAELVARGRSIAVVGPPKVGKRTVLNALTNLIQPDARLVVLEDGQRMRLHHEHVVRIDAASLNDGASNSALRVVQRLRPDWLLIGDSAAVGPDELFAVQAEGLPPWIAVFAAHDGPDFLERSKHSLLMRYPGMPESVAEARALRGLDAVAVFVPDGASSWVLSEVFEVARHRTGGRTLVDLSPESVRSAL